MGFHVDGTVVWMPVHGPVVNLVIDAVIPAFDVHGVTGVCVVYAPKPKPQPQPKPEGVTRDHS